MAIVPKGPNELLSLFQRQMDEIFSLLLQHDKKGYPPECEFSPSIDIYETGDRFVVEIEAPGFERDDLALRSYLHMLIVEGVKKQEPVRSSARFICMERNFGRFCRAVELPQHIDMQSAQAAYRLGVLTVVFDKLAEKQLGIREIPIE